MSVRLILESSTNIRPDLAGRAHIIPMPLVFGNEEFLDGVTIDNRELYERMASGGALPTTSQASPDAFAREFQAARDAGDEAVVLTVSSRLSGTYQSANIAAQDFDNVHIVDTMNVAIGAGVLAEHALTLIDSGHSAKATAAELVALRPRIRLLGVINTLENLKRSGRISKTIAFAGSLLGVKPLFQISDGVIGFLGKARGAKQAIAQLIRHIEADVPDPSLPILFGYTGLDPEPIHRFIRESSALWTHATLPITTVSSVIGVHAGPGAFALSYAGKLSLHP